MKILIIGSGGREHALATAYAKSKKVTAVFVAPGNDLMSFQNKKIQTFPHIKSLEFEKILSFVKKEKINLVDVAQDDPLAAGLVDFLTEAGIQTFGPTKKASEIEWNKDWARNFMQKYHLPIPHFVSFSEQKKAIAYISKLKQQTLFIKASGLALGKGVIKAENKEQAIDAIQQMERFGKSGKTFLIEEALIGEEFSLFAMCDGVNYKILQAAQDHKTVYNANQGSNTGGMGCVAPSGVVSKKIVQEVERTILKPFLNGMQKEGRPYTGILYLGGMMTKQGVKIIEFNARWGDPEAQVILPALQTDYLELVSAVLNKQIHKTNLVFDEKIRISIAACANGYPTDYKHVVGKEIFGLQQTMKLPGIILFGAGIKRKGKRFFVSGGRIFHLVAEGKTAQEARQKAYAAISLIFIEGDNLHFRTDIGWKEQERFYL